jgi:hypothetical protein
MNVKCTSCGAQQDLAATGNCSYCGNTIELSQGQEAYTTVMQGEVGNLIVMAETAVDAGNWEEALQYYNRILEKQITNSDAWLGKGIAMVNTSTIGTMKVTEAIAYWKNAVKNAPDQVAMGKRVAKEIDRVVQGFYPVLENHYVQFRTMDNAYSELVGRFMQLEKAQSEAISLDQNNITLLTTGFDLCKRVIDIPALHANVDGTFAALEGIAGQLSSNEYTRQRNAQDAIQKRSEAKNRKDEIMNQQRKVAEIQLKYVNGINSINPGNSVKQSFGSAKTDDAYTVQFVVDTFKSENRRILRTEMLTKKKFNISDSESKELVRQILLQKGLVNQSDIKGADNLVNVLTWVLLIGAIIAIVFGALIK